MTTFDMATTAQGGSAAIHFCVGTRGSSEDRLMGLKETLAAEQLRSEYGYVRSQADVRRDRIERIKNQVAAGTYRVSSMQLAECLMDAMTRR